MIFLCEQENQRKFDLKVFCFFSSRAKFLSSKYNPIIGWVLIVRFFLHSYAYRLGIRKILYCIYTWPLGICILILILI
ncbi:MAG TPA: hypothetical protein DCG69_07510 [Bacteroidales bacterium]|nr:hypothetical protein [Bacteroidales bacterium]